MTSTAQTFPQHRGWSVGRFLTVVIAAALVTAVATGAVMFMPLSNGARALTFHTTVVDAGSVLTLAPGTTAHLTLKFRNAGITAWERGVAGSRVDLGVRGDSHEFAQVGMAVDWLSDDRIATTNESIVPPGSVGTFTFGVRAPKTLGLYRIPVQLVVDGVTWLDDQQVFVVVASDFGFHSELIEQSRHPTLRAGETSAPLTVKLRNTGTRAWVRGNANEQVNLGADADAGVLKALAAGWPTADRVAIQTEPRVEPGDVGSFVFRVRAPSTTGIIPLHLRPVVDGVTWLEDSGAVSLITVTSASTQSQPLAAQAASTLFASSASVAPMSVSAGDAATISASFTSNTASTALVAVEIYAPHGATLAYQKWFDAQTFAAGEPRSYPVTWQIPATALTGTYTVTLRAFAPGWRTQLGSTDAATFTVTEPVSAVPAATAVPGATGATAALVSVAADGVSTPTADQLAAAAAERANANARKNTPKPTVTPTAAPAPRFTTSATAAPAAVDRSGSVNVTASYTSATAVTVNLIASIYAPGASLAAYQQSYAGQSFGTGQQRGYPLTWAVPSDAAPGTYRVALGVYSTDGSTEYTWTDVAATFAVNAPASSPTPLPPTPAPTVTPNATPAPTATPAATATATSAPTATPASTATATSAPTATPASTATPAPTATAAPTPTPAPSFVQTGSVAPTTVVAGSSVLITNTVTSVVATSALVDMEVYDSSGIRVFSAWTDGQSFTAGQTRSYPSTWQTPAGLVPGTYRVALGVFSPAWATLWAWTHQATTLTVTAAGPTPTPAPTPAPTPTPTLPPPPGFSAVHVSGNQLVNASGQTVVLHGANRSGMEFACVQGWGLSDGPRDLASILAMKSWKINAVRVPLNEDCWLAINGVSPSYSGAIYQQAVKDYVNLLTANGIYAIVDIHWSAPGATPATGQQPMPDMDHSPAFWTGVATAFKGNGAVLFDLFNEPWPNNQANNTASWTCWRDGTAGGTCTSVPYTAVGMQSLVNTVRATGATNVLLLGGVSYSNALGSWLAYKPTDPAGNLAASWHIYNFNVCNPSSCWDANVAPLAAVVPVVALEIGVDNCDAVYFNAIMNWLDAHQLGYLAWTWDTWGASCSTFALISDFGGTPTTYGQLLRSHLALLP